MTTEAKQRAKDIVIPVGIVVSMMSAAFYTGQLSIRVSHIEEAQKEIASIQKLQAQSILDLQLAMRDVLAKTKTP